MLNPWRLKMLQELAGRGTMTEVAKVLYLTPSAVSQQLALLEHEAGIPLFEHRNRRVTLTPAAMVLAASATRILDAIELAEIEIAQLRDTVAGDVRISAFPTVAAALIPSTMVELRDSYPQLRLSLQDLEPYESVKALRLGEVDIAVIDEFDVASGEFDQDVERTLLGTDNLCCALPADHPMAGATGIRIADLAAERWAMVESSTCYYRQIAESCHEAGFQPDVVARCHDAFVLLELAEAGACVAVLPSLALTRASTRIVVRPIVPAIERRVYLAIRAGRAGHPGIAACVDQIVKVAARVPQFGGAKLSTARSVTDVQSPLQQE
jgi:DNA-binding transcriptional LysR family regulator